MPSPWTGPLGASVPNHPKNEGRRITEDPGCRSHVLVGTFAFVSQADAESGDTLGLILLGHHVLALTCQVKAESVNGHCTVPKKMCHDSLDDIVAALRLFKDVLHMVLHLTFKL